MKASDAVYKVSSCTELEVRLHKLSVAISGDSTTVTKLSEKCGVPNICDILDCAVSLLHEYHIQLDAALMRTELEGIE